MPDSVADQSSEGLTWPKNPSAIDEVPAKVERRSSREQNRA